ncbi:MAG: SPOR domain-containing protein, partial [Cyanobacteriota bacterium]|nr:SPOR domain-containing protein [Cyanobacteriota bacterium]
EFVELDLDTLSNISPNPAPIPVVPPAPAANSQNLTPPSPLPSGPGMNNLTNELLPEPVLPTPKPAAPAQTVTPKPASGAATKPKTNPVQAPDGLYYVVTTYTNPQSLEKARTVVADAYVRDFKTGKKVQLGALDNPEAAKRLAEQLRVQGISVQFDAPKTGE